jgi:hypothetical protein
VTGNGVICGDLDPYSARDMVTLARAALAEWRASRSGSAAERKVARRLAFAVGRLESLGVLAVIEAGASTAAGS